MPFVQVTRYSDPLVDYLDYAHDIRGRIINSIAEMEPRIDAYICEYFCETREKRTELTEIIISTKHLNFRAKADILRYLLEKREDATKKEAAQIWGHLMNTIAPKRNMLAHNQLDTSIGSINKFKKEKETVYFLKYINEKRVIPFGKKEVIKLLELTQSISGFFLLIKSPSYKML
jgi:hypothetical protein